MTTDCAVSGCDAPRADRGRLCEAHAAQRDRHGHPEQRGVTAAELTRYQRIVRGHIRRNRTSPVWDQLDTAWRNLLKECDQEARSLRRRPGAPRRDEALEHCAKLMDAAKPGEAVETILAMFLVLQFDPRRFRSNEAFKYQLVRRVRSLSGVNAGAASTGRSRGSKQAPRDLRPKATLALADMLIDAFARAGTYIALHEHARLEELGAAQRELDKALAALK